MPRCPFCDKRNSASATECSECGAELSTPDSRSASQAADLTGPESDIGEAVPESELDPFEVELVGLLKEGQKIEAIKRYRKKTGADLKSAKVAVEQFALQQGLPGSQGCVISSVILLAVVVTSLMLL